MVENVGRLHHLHHKGGLAPVNLVAGAQPGDDAVHHAERVGHHQQGHHVPRVGGTRPGRIGHAPNASGAQGGQGPN